MKTKLLAPACMILFGMLFNQTNAQQYKVMPIQNGFNADVIANGVGTASSSTTTSIDLANYVLVSKDYKLTNASTPLTYGLPVNGIINSVFSSTPDLTYQLASYSSNNSLKLKDINDSGTINFSTPTQAVTLYMLATSGNGASTVNITVNFSDSSTQVFSGINILDWYDGSSYAITNLGRINITNDALEPGDSRLQQIQLTITPANQTKSIKSIIVSKTAGGIANIFAFSAEAYNSCSAPNNITITPNGGNAMITWTAPSSAPSSGYEYYYSTSSTPPSASTTPTGSVPFGANSVNLSGLANNQTYYFWVRSNCGSTKGFWQMKQFMAGKIIVIYTAGDISTLLNLDPVPTSTTTCPGSLSINIPTGYKIKSTDVSYSITALSSGWMIDQQSILVCLNNNTAEPALSSGTGLSPGTLQYNRTGLAIANNLTGTVNFELRAWRQFGGTACDTSYNKVDNNSFKITVTLEPLTTLNVNEGMTASKEIMVYPNPFTDDVTIEKANNVKRISVIDLSGITVKTIDNPSSTLHLGELKTGVYILSLTMKDGSIKSSKMIKK